MKTESIAPLFTPQEIALQQQGTQEFTQALEKETTSPTIWFGDTNYSSQMKAGVHGHFAQSLFNAWVHASAPNRRKLVEAFPENFPKEITLDKNNEFSSAGQKVTITYY